MKTSKRSFTGFKIAIKVRLKQMIGRLKITRKASQQAIHGVEYRVISQHREDGIIDYLLDTVGQSNGVFVEFGFAISECNCMNLVLNRKFKGLFIDGSSTVCSQAIDALAWLNIDDVKVENAFLSVENINNIIKDNGFAGEIDVLSVDIDGNDYWLWSAIDVVNPRIVVAEYNATFGKEKAITIPYDPKFIRYEKHSSGFYHGASLRALHHLGIQKGYQLVGCDFTGVNAFFVRNDLVSSNNIEVISVDDAFVENRGRVKYKKISTEKQFQKIADQPFVDVLD